VYNWFSVITGLGASLGLLLVALRAPQYQAIRWMEAGLWILLISLVGARVAFVMINWGYFQTRWLDSLQIWLGGLSWIGAAAGALLGLAGVALARKQSLGLLADAMLPLVLPLCVAAWLGAWEAGTAYGAPASGVWWAVPSINEWGVWTLRWPLQPLGAVASLAIFWLVERLHPRLRRPGQAASLAFAGLVLSVFGLSFRMAEPGLSWRGWRLDSWAALVFTGLAFILCLAAFWPFHQKNEGK